MTLIEGDCITVMAGLPAASVDAIVTDPPYGLEFMGRTWDKLGAGFHAPKDEGRTFTNDSGHMFDNLKSLPRFGPAVAMQEWHHRWATEALRVTRPGGYLLAFGGDRTVHRLTTAIEDAGWTIRGMLLWVHAQGFPKSLNVSQALLERVPEDARCACAHRSSGTVLGSPTGYRPERGSSDGLPHPVQDNVLASAPSRADVRGRNRVDQHVDGPGLGLGHSPAPASIGRPSTEGSPDLVEWAEEAGRAVDNARCGTPSSTSRSHSTMPGSTASRIPRMSGSADGSAPSSWSPPRGEQFPYSKCRACGGWCVVPGYGTALKPSFEPIVMARKPLSGTVAENVERYGTGALNIDGTRIGGRFPSNLVLTDPIFDGDTEGVVGGGQVESQRIIRRTAQGVEVGIYSPGERAVGEIAGYGDTGTYSRFFMLPRSATLSGRIGTCERCGAPIAESSASSVTPASSAGSAPSPASEPPASFIESTDQVVPAAASLSPSPVTATAPRRAATPPGGTPASTVSVDESPTASDTSGIATSIWHEVERDTTFPSETPARTAAPPSTSTGTTTTTAVPSMCERCADDATHGRTLPPLTPTARGPLPADSEDYARFYLVPKANRSEREPVLPSGLELRRAGVGDDRASGSFQERLQDHATPMRVNSHPTVKPLDLMRHLVRLVTPTGGVVLDPFLGSGTTAIAAEMEGFAWIGIEREAEYCQIIEARLAGTQRGLGLDVGAPTPPASRPTGMDTGHHPYNYVRNSPKFGGIYQAWESEQAPLFDDELPA